MSDKKEVVDLGGVFTELVGYESANEMLDKWFEQHPDEAVQITITAGQVWLASTLCDGQIVESGAPSVSYHHAVKKLVEADKDGS